MSFTAVFQAFYIENSSRSDFKEKPRQAQKREIKRKSFFCIESPPQTPEGEAHNRSLIYKCKRWSIFKAKHFLGSDEILAAISLARVLGFMAH